ncbi:GNAT family N-acetyltransferase [Ornithinimicrobium pekingense]|uniref:N-acetyltransferase n=1 Tax=Ornithinimicrobium pekingense TaxID=384677 RepID=A0ABQ2F9D9_9MICO|nr:GNAT family N-acetyltransferase [Ornithinimicrobium pekingense]GGK66359.1 N-acetyltransferase [Ornithinimicrobium pekingense]
MSPVGVPGDRLRIVPANEAACEDLDAVLGTRGPGSRCLCQRYKLARGEAFGSFPAEERASRWHDQTSCGDPTAPATSGLVAYSGDEPVGWCAVEPRTAYQGLVRVFTVPWKDRTEDRRDPSVWAVTCVFVRAGHRRRGIGSALALAAVPFARGRGASALEAYPITTTAVIDEELHVGTVPMFEAAGMRQVAAPTPRRVVMRLDL